MDIVEFEQRVRRGLAAKLPGGSAHLLMSPRPRRGWKPGQAPEGCRDGAGLLLVYPQDDEVVLVLTVRHPELPLHAGQVSLPGGSVEPGETIDEAALREAHEEIGVEPVAVRVLGRLSPLHIPVSRYVLHPVLGRVAERPQMSPREGEVHRVLEVPLGRLADPRRLGLERHSSGGVEYEIPYFNVDGEKLWGATAMVVAELLVLSGMPPQRLP